MQHTTIEGFEAQDFRNQQSDHEDRRDLSASLRKSSRSLESSWFAFVSYWERTSFAIV